MSIASDGHGIAYDPEPWVAEGSQTFRGRQWMTAKFPKALPLTELELTPKERES